MATLLRRIDRAVVALALGLAMALLCAMACVSLWQVATRFLLERPSTWSEVTSRSLQIWMVYLGLVGAFRSGALMSVDLLANVLPPRARLVLTAALAGLSLGVLAVMLWHGWAMALRVQSQRLAGIDNPFGEGGVSIALVYAAIPVGAALCVVAVLARLAEDVARLRRGDPPEAGTARAQEV